MLFRISTAISGSLTALVVGSIMLQGCSTSAVDPRRNSGSPGSTTTSENNQTTTGSQQEILAAQQDHARKVEVTVDATVQKKLPDDTKGLPHERFLIRLNNGSNVLVAHDTKMAPYVPLQAGDTVRIHGEYIWNDKGGVLHWTHHADTGHHEGGWIDYRGQRYQ